MFNRQVCGKLEIGNRKQTRSGYIGVLIISEYSKNPANEIFMCLPITSWEGDDPFMIKINAQDLEKGSFAKPSQVVCDNIFTILKTDADSEKGKVTNLFYTRVTKLLKEKILKI